MSWWQFIIAVPIVIGIIVGAAENGIKPQSTEGLNRTGRIGLWIVFWPAGLWRSWKHGQKKAH